MISFNRILAEVLPAPLAYFENRRADTALRDTRREIDDTLINAAVKIALYRDPCLRTAGIHVATSRCVVQLSGFVDSRRAIDKAVEAAREVRGVRSVKNDMRLK